LCYYLDAENTQVGDQLSEAVSIEMEREPHPKDLKDFEHCPQQATLMMYRQLHSEDDCTNLVKKHKVTLEEQDVIAEKWNATNGKTYASQPCALPIYLRSYSKIEQC